MVVDFAVHSPDKEDGGISNPHFHVMCPIRPLDEHGRWGNKQRREYVLDDGERVLMSGQLCVQRRPHDRLGKPETLEAWRRHGLRCATPSLLQRAWTAASTTAALPVRAWSRSHPARRSHRPGNGGQGYPHRQGRSQPLDQKTNAMLREAKQKIAALIGWMKDVKAERQAPDAHAERSAGAALRQSQQGRIQQ